MSDREPARSVGRLGGRSLTVRLVLGALGLVVVLIGAIGAGTYLSLRAYLLGRLDQQVASSAQQNAAFVDRCETTCAGGPGPGCVPLARLADGATPDVAPDAAPDAAPAGGGATTRAGPPSR